MTSVYDYEQVDRFAAERRIDPHFIRRLRHALFRDRQNLERALKQLPAEHRGAFTDRFAEHELRLVERRDSCRDQATKLLFETARGHRLETVLMQNATGRITACLSSQVGCAADCRFCATGTMGLRQQLSAGEILDQLVQADRWLAQRGTRVRNVVFMGMGEPFHNETAVTAALDLLHHDHGLARAPRRTLVSTIGVPDAMLRFARRYPTSRLALSLHSASEATRRQLMPVAARVSLPELRRTLELIETIHSHGVLIEYVMLADVNDSRDDARQLAEYLRGLHVLVNLIPFNPVGLSPADCLLPVSRRHTRQFANWLREQGYSVTVRDSLGGDIAAACGQLAALSGS